jgi:hypothetical protein
MATTVSETMTAVGFDAPGGPKCFAPKPCRCPPGPGQVLLRSPMPESTGPT